MTDLSICHRTCYRYRRPVALGPHRMMLRPRDGRLLSVQSFHLAISPQADLCWTQDVFGNAVAIARFTAMSQSLVIESSLALSHAELEWPVFLVAASALTYPFDYENEEDVDLGALRSPVYDDPDGQFAAWVRGFVAGERTDTLSLLKDLNAGISTSVTYEVREEYGTQSPLASLSRGRGSCRDIATVLAEAVRVLGFGARLVSGYLWDPSGSDTGAAGTGSTHAWCEIYVPGAGWIAFDPTNRVLGAGHLIPVATARRIEQIAPLTGGYSGDADDILGMEVAVKVAERAGSPDPIFAASVS